MPKNGGGGGSSNRGRGRGGGSGGKFGSGKGRGLGFVPFSGHGNTLGNGDISESQPSLRGSGGGGRPYRGRGRGGNLSAQGQNRVAFDYAALDRRSFQEPNAALAQAKQGQLPDEDFVIEPPARYKHKVMPHLETAQLSDNERTTESTSTARAPHLSQPAIEQVASGSREWNTKFRRGVAPTSYPEFHTSRGANGFKQRPPEETEDARYLAGIPGLRRAERGQQRPSRFEQRISSHDSPLRKPVTFVKALHKAFVDPLDDEHVEKTEEPAVQAREALQQSSHALDLHGHPFKHAGLGFSNKAERKAQSPDRPTQPDFSLDDEVEQDEVNALLAAFPGSKELAPEESMVDSSSTYHLNPMPSIFTNNVVKAQDVLTNPQSGENEDEDMFDEQDENVVDEQDDEVLAMASQIKQEATPLPTDLYEPRQYTESDSEEERQLDAILAQSRMDNIEHFNQEEDNDETQADATEGVGFVIDLTGAAPNEDESLPTQQSNRIALGDVLPPSALQPSAGMQQETQAPKKARRRIPREGDSDLEWGSDGPPGTRSDDGNNTDGEIVAAAAGISFNDAAPVQVDEEPSQSVTQGRLLDELMLARAIRADKHEWDVSDTDMASILRPTIGDRRKRGGARAKRSMPNKAAGLRKVAETSRARKAHEAAAVADYMENIMNQQDDEDDDEQVDDILGQNEDEIGHKGPASTSKQTSRNVLDIMTQFMNGMDPQKGGKQMSFGDVQDEIHIAETKEWMTESEDESDTEGPVEEVDEVNEAARRQMSAVAARKQTVQQAVEASEAERFAHEDDDEDLIEQLRVILTGQSNSETDSGSPGPYSDDDDDDKDEEEDEDDTSSSDDSEDDDDEDDSDNDMFKGGKTSWADEDEEFIKALSAQMGPGKRSEKDVFKAISRGDFSDMVDDSIEIDSDDPAFGVGTVPTARNGKRKGRKWNDDDLWAEELQKQWDKDRVSKATRKQQRAMEKAAAALNPYPNTHGKMSKKAAKQMRRAEKRDARASLKAHSNNALAAIQAAGGIDAVDQGLLAFGGKGTDLTSIGLDQRFAFNMDELNEQIQLFLADRGKTTLTLQAMDKFARAEVHQLAAAYSLKSQSKGKGDKRFPTLIKTSRSGYNVNERKIRRIISSNAGASFGNDSGRSDFKNKNKRLGNGARRMVGQDGGGAPAPRNRDGEEVGFGADKIGADNIGHRLLAAMGWSEGMGIGHSGGMANPVAATVKITKGGLGF